MSKEATNMEIIEVLNIFSEKMDKRMDKIEERIDKLEDKLTVMINGLRVEVVQRLDYHEAWLNRIDQNVVWKKDLKV